MPPSDIMQTDASMLSALAAAAANADSSLTWPLASWRVPREAGVLDVERAASAYGGKATWGRR